MFIRQKELKIPAENAEMAAVFDFESRAPEAMADRVSESGGKAPVSTKPNLALASVILS